MIADLSFNYIFGITEKFYINCSDLSVVAGMIGNVISVVGVVMMNKYIVTEDNFNFMLLLSFLHFSVTYFASLALMRMGYFTSKEAPLSSVLPCAIGSLLSVAFMNLNLAYNSVGFYQLSKLACIPITIMLEYFFYKKIVSWPILMTLIPITFGVGVATVNDVSLNMKGTVFAIAAVVATALAQIFTSSYQKELNCNALQLLVHTAPVISFGMFCMIPFFDDMKALQNATLTIPLITHILLSCLFAFGVNVSNYLVLGKTSPLTYQVLGHMKTILIFLFGFLFFSQKYNAKILSGIFLALVGVILYTDFKQRGIGSMGSNPEIKKHQAAKISIDGLMETKALTIASEENFELLGDCKRNSKNIQIV